jgi:hypothetical protein
MMMIVSQAIVAVFIIALFIITFRFDKSKTNTKEMALIAFFCILCAVLSKFLSIKFPPGQPIFVISFASAISITIGLLVSPKKALIAGFIIDVLGIIIAPLVGDGSMPFLGFTLTAMLSCYLPCIIYSRIKNLSNSILNFIIVIILGISIALASIYLYSTNTISIDKTKNVLNDGLRLSLVVAFIVIAVIILVVNYFLNKKIKQDNQVKLSVVQLSLIVLVVEIVCHIILTSLWIMIMYQVPFIVGASTRIIKALIMLPLNVVVVYLLVSYLPKQYKERLLKKFE